MRTGPIIAVLLSYFPIMAIAAECDSRDLPQALIELIKKQKYAEAEASAKEALDKVPSDLQAHKVLANVYINSAIREGINLDLNMLGFKPGESEARAITSEQMKGAVSPRTVVDPEYRKKADAHVNALIRRWPDQNDYYYCLTKIHFYAGDHKEFLRYLDLTATSHASQEREAIDFLIGYGREYLVNNQARGAVDVYEILLRTFPKSAPALSSLGVAWLRLNDSEKAAMYFDRAFALDPKDVIVVGNVAEIAMIRGDFSRAEVFFKKKLKLTPAATSVYLDLAMNAMHKGPKASIPYWKDYFARNKINPDDKTWVAAAENIYQSIRDGNVDDKMLFEIARQMIEWRAPKYAVPILFHLKRKQPQDATYAYILAQAYDVGGYVDLGEKMIANTIALKTKFPDSLPSSLSQIHYNHSRMLYQLNRKDAALSALEHIARSDKSYVGALYMYGLIHSDFDRTDQARSYLNKCIEVAGNDPIKEYCENLVKKVEANQ